MKCLYQQQPAPCLDVDVANRAQGNAAAGIERVQHPFPLFVVDEFLLKGPENLRIGRLQLKSNSVLHATTTGHAVAVGTRQTMRHEAAFGWQRMVRRRGNFGQCQPAVSPSHHVSGTGDVNFRLKTVAVYFPCLKYFEQFGVQRPPVYLKRKLSDFGTYGGHGFGSFNKQTAMA